MISCRAYRTVLGAVVILALTGCELVLRPHPLTRLDAPPVLPEPAGSYLDLGRHLLRGGEFGLAKQAFVRSMRVEGLSAAALTGAGLAAERQGLLTEARRYFERARIRAPNSVLAHNNLGAVLYRMGAFHEAKQAFQAAFALSSGKNKVAAHNLHLSELAIRRLDLTTSAEIANPVPVQRRGKDEYRLLLTDQDQEEG